MDAITKNKVQQILINALETDIQLSDNEYLKQFEEANGTFHTQMIIENVTELLEAAREFVPPIEDYMTMHKDLVDVDLIEELAIKKIEKLSDKNCIVLLDVILKNAMKNVTI